MTQPQRVNLKQIHQVQLALTEQRQQPQPIRQQERRVTKQPEPERLKILQQARTQQQVLTKVQQLRVEQKQHQNSKRHKYNDLWKSTLTNTTDTGTVTNSNDGDVTDTKGISGAINKATTSDLTKTGSESNSKDATENGSGTKSPALLETRSEKKVTTL